MRDSRRTRLVLTILLLAAFTLVTLDYRSGALGGARRTASTLFGPIEGAVNSVVHPVGSWFAAIGHLGSYKSDNAALRKRLSAAEQQLHLTDQLRVQLAQRTAIDHLAGTAQFTVVHAEVTALGGDLGFEQTATINVGSAQGIRPQQTVINGAGLVGKVEHVGRTASTILLASDPTSTVGVRLEKSGEAGYVKGGGRGALTLTLLSSTAPITVGDRLVTLGSKLNTPYVPAVPVGHVIAVAPASGSLGRTATVAPYVNFTAVEEVAVVVKSPKRVSPNSLLPPSPHPTPTPTVTVTVTASPGSRPSGSGGSATPGATPTSP